MGQKVRAAVFPVAGRGTRFLPATKASPKEMLPIVDKPLIQYAVEEAIAAGATKLVFVTGASKRAIEDHFDTDPELEKALSGAGKDHLLRSIRDVVPAGVSCIYIRQGEPLGLGHAVLCARPAIGNEPFFIHLADDLIAAEPGCLAQMAAEHAEHGGSVVAVETVPHENTSSYGIVAVDESNHIVERKYHAGTGALLNESGPSFSSCGTDLFFALTPHKVLEAVEDAYFPTNPLCYPLNSFENRVYEVELADRSRVVAKFYRPERWSNGQILAEHRLLAEARKVEIPELGLGRKHQSQELLIAILIAPVGRPHGGVTVLGQP